jgi:hypothetical protein
MSCKSKNTLGNTGSHGQRFYFLSKSEKTIFHFFISLKNHIKIIISWEKNIDKSLKLEFYKFGS